MPKKSGSTYEIIFKNGACLHLNNIANIDIEFTNREITKFNITRIPGSDELKFINISEIISIKKNGREKRWWRR